MINPNLISNSKKGVFQNKFPARSADGRSWLSHTRLHTVGKDARGKDAIIYGLIDARSRHIDNPRIRNCPYFMICFSKELPTPLLISIQFTICVYDNAASRLSGVVCPAPSREFGGRVGRLVDGSQPSLARRVRKALRWSSAALGSSEPPVRSRLWTIWRVPDQRLTRGV